MHHIKSQSKQQNTAMKSLTVLLIWGKKWIRNVSGGKGDSIFHSELQGVEN